MSFLGAILLGLRYGVVAINRVLEALVDHPAHHDLGVQGGVALLPELEELHGIRTAPALCQQLHSLLAANLDGLLRWIARLMPAQIDASQLDIMRNSKAAREPQDDEEEGRGGAGPRAQDQHAGKLSPHLVVICSLTVISMSVTITTRTGQL